MNHDPVAARRHRAFLPSLAALAAFDAAARRASFTKAAEELNLTQSAVSRQIRLLEETLGLPLFERIRQRVVLTPAGASYARDVTATLGRLAAATASLMASRGAGGTLNLAILPTFGTRWLIPRLPGFFAAHPEVTINFTTRIRPFDLDAEAMDAAIHVGDPVWPGADLHRLMGEIIVPVASPGLIAQAGLKMPEDCLTLPLLQQDTRPRAWPQWLEAQGLDPAKAIMGPRFEQFAMVAQAAVAGLGAAIVPRFLIADELRAGTLQILFDRPLVSPQAYYLVYPTEKRAHAPIIAFRDWLLAEVGKDDV